MEEHVHFLSVPVDKHGFVASIRRHLSDVVAVWERSEVELDRWTEASAAEGVGGRRADDGRLGVGRPRALSGLRRAEAREELAVAASPST